jgi:hypothetical protein
MTTIAYSVSDFLFGRLSPGDVRRSVDQAVAEWNRVLIGHVVFVPWRKGQRVPSVLITFGQKYKAIDVAAEERVAATCTTLPGEMDPRWIVELKDDPKINWVPYPTTQWGRWFRRTFGATRGSTPITSVLLHELGHVLQLPHEARGVDGLVMSTACATRDAITRMESERYRTWFENYVVTRQHD